MSVISHPQPNPQGLGWRREMTDISAYQNINSSVFKEFAFWSRVEGRG